MEWFFLDPIQLSIFGLACVGGILAKSYRNGVAFVGRQVGMILFISLCIMSYKGLPLSHWIGGCIFVILGKAAGGNLVVFATSVLGQYIWFARIFPSPRVFMLARSQMQFHELDCHGYKICILRPGETAPKEYYDNLRLLSDFAEVNAEDKYDVGLLEYRLLIVGGREPSATALVVSYQLSFLRGDNLLAVENAKKRVTDYICRNIFRDNSTIGDDEHKVKLTNLQINASDRPYIRYSEGTSDLSYGEYFHFPINSELMLTLHIQNHLEIAEAIAAAKDVVKFLLDDFHISPLGAEGAAQHAWVGWQSQVWAEVEPPPLSPEEFLTQDDFSQFLETHAEDPLMWTVFQQSANYDSWFNFQYGAHLDKFNAGYPRIFQEKMPNYTMAEKQEKPGDVYE